MAGNKEEVKLIGSWTSPFVARARIALHLKGIKYDFLQEESGKKSELLLKSNPVYGKIPVLIHLDKPVCESFLIVQYIDEVWVNSSPPILPADPYDRAVARFWATYIDNKLVRQILSLFTAADEAIKAATKEQVFAVLQQLEEAFEKTSNGNRFFGGDTIGYLDIALGSILGWMKAIGKLEDIKFLDETKNPRLVRWAESFCSVDTVKEVMPEVDKLVEYGPIMRANIRARAAPTK